MFGWRLYINYAVDLNITFFTNKISQNSLDVIYNICIMYFPTKMTYNCFYGLFNYRIGILLMLSFRFRQLYMKILWKQYFYYIWFYIYFLLNCIVTNIYWNSNFLRSNSRILFMFIYSSNNNKIEDHIIIYFHLQLKYHILISVLPQMLINNHLSLFYFYILHIFKLC